MSTLCLHATTISLNGSAVLIRGASCSGKSSLALMVLETVGTGLGAEVITTTLVADDQTVLLLRDGQIYASPPATIAGLLEVRGQGILTVPFARDIPLVLVVDLKPSAEIDRLPEHKDMEAELLGLRLPCVTIDPHVPSAASRLRVAWARHTIRQ